MIYFFNKLKDWIKALQGVFIYSFVSYKQWKYDEITSNPSKLDSSIVNMQMPQFQSHLCYRKSSKEDVCVGLIKSL